MTQPSKDTLHQQPKAQPAPKAGTARLHEKAATAGVSEPHKHADPKDHKDHKDHKPAR